ncbi:MAG: sugar phosphate isomerase/epimerase family protein, partial [Acetanaerobacterium sp.]
RLYELGRSYGVFVAQENVVRCRSHSAQFIGEMRSALGEDVRFVLDTKQAVRAGQDLFEMVDAMGERLLHVHLSDHSERGDCLPVGSGTLDIKRLLNALKTVGFDENVIMELYRENFDEPEELMVSLKTLEYFSETYK